MLLYSTMNSVVLIHYWSELHRELPVLGLGMGGSHRVIARKERLHYYSACMVRTLVTP